MQAETHSAVRKCVYGPSSLGQRPSDPCGVTGTEKATYVCVAACQTECACRCVCRAALCLKRCRGSVFGGWNDLTAQYHADVIK